MKLKNCNPLGEVFFPLIGKVLAAGEEFDIDDERGAALLDQAGNFELVPAPTRKSTATKEA